MAKVFWGSVDQAVNEEAPLYVSPEERAQLLANLTLRVLQALAKGRSQEPAKMDGSGSTGGALSTRALRGPAAFVLLDSKKGALGVGYEKGTGVLIKALAKAGEAPSLSAPLPVYTTKFGIGLSIGYSELYSVLMLNQESDIESILKGEYTVNTDCEVPLVDAIRDHQAAYMGAAGKLVSVSDNYALVDFSMSGGKLAVDADALKGLYGDSAKPEDVVSGHTPIPSEFLPVYEYLKEQFMQK